MTRRLRISASVFFAVMAVALCVLWVRSYSHHELFNTRISSGLLVITSNRGWLHFDKIGGMRPVFGGSFLSEPPVEVRWSKGTRIAGISWHVGFVSWQIALSYRYPVLMFVVLATTSWIPEWPTRFSLRTLFTATTLLAVVLGLTMWLVTLEAGL